jgi:hypothetical protein
MRLAMEERRPQAQHEAFSPFIWTPTEKRLGFLASRVSALGPSETFRPGWPLFA